MVVLLLAFGATKDMVCLDLTPPDTVVTSDLRVLRLWEGSEFKKIPTQPLKKFFFNDNLIKERTYD